MGCRLAGCRLQVSPLARPLRKGQLATCNLPTCNQSREDMLERVGAVRRTARSTSLVRATTALVILALLLAGCRGAKSNLPKGANGPIKVSLVLDWYPWADHTGLYLAQSKGYFKDEGLEVDIHPPSNPDDILKAVGAGTDNFGISYQTDVLTARAANVP